MFAGLIEVLAPIFPSLGVGVVILVLYLYDKVTMTKTIASKDERIRSMTDDLIAAYKGVEKTTQGLQSAVQDTATAVRETSRVNKESAKMIEKSVDKMERLVMDVVRKG